MTEFNLQLDLWISSGRALKYFKERDQEAVGPMTEVCAGLLAQTNPKQIAGPA
jgi:hypothetical protein